MIGKHKPVLKGDGFHLRPLLASDAEAMFADINDPESARLTGSGTQFTFAQVDAHCHRIEHADDRLDYGIEAGGRLIGELVLNDYDAANRSASMRIAIWSRDNRNMGWGRKALGLLLDYAFTHLPLNRIALEVHAFNPRAMHVYEAIGFRREGTMREALWWDGEPVDTHVMAMLKSDFDAAGGDS